MVLDASYDCVMEINDEVIPSVVRTWLIVWRRKYRERLFIACGRCRPAN